MATAKQFVRPRARRVRFEFLLLLVPLVGICSLVYMGRHRLIALQGTIMEAIAARDADQVRTQLAHGADPNQKYQDHSLLFYAIHEGNNEIIDLLLQHGAKANLDKGSGKTPLLEAIGQEDPDLVRRLIRVGADPNSLEPNQNLPLSMAARAGRIDVMKALIDNGAKVNAAPEGQLTALQEAAMADHEDAVQFLLGRGAGIDDKDSTGATALVSAVKANKTKLAQFLISLGADVNTHINGGPAPLHFAAAQSNLELIDVLISKGAQVSSKGFQERTPLHAAALYGNLDAVRKLVEAGADVNALEVSGNTPLMLALTRQDCADMAEYLLDAGTDPTVSNKAGFNALHLAASGRAGVPFVQKLLDMGVPVNSMTGDKETALNIAEDADKPEISAIISSRGGKETKMGNTVSGALAVVSRRTNRLVLLDAQSGNTLKRVRVGNQPHEVAISPNGRLAAVSNYGPNNTPGNTISIVDLGIGKVRRTVVLNKHKAPHGISWIDDDRFLVTTEQPDSVVEIDAATGTVQRNFVFSGKRSHELIVARGQVWISNVDASYLSVVDLTSGKEVGKAELGEKGPEGLCASPDGREIWVTMPQKDLVIVVDAASRKVLKSIPVKGAPIRVAFTPDGRRIFVSCIGVGSISVLDSQSKREIKRINLAKVSANGDPVAQVQQQVPLTYAMDPRTNRAFVTITNADEVATIDLSDLKLGSRFEVENPDGMAFTHALDRTR